MSEPNYITLDGPLSTTKETFRHISESLVEKLLAYVESHGKAATVIGLPRMTESVDEALASRGVRVVRYFDPHINEYRTMAMTLMVDKP